MTSSGGPIHSSENRLLLPALVQNLINVHENARSHTTAVTDILRRWAWGILEHSPYSPDMSPAITISSPKEPLRGTRYNTRDELIRAIGRSIRNSNKYRRADGVRRLRNIWQKEINRARISMHYQILKHACIHALSYD